MALAAMLWYSSLGSRTSWGSGKVGSGARSISFTGSLLLAWCGRGEPTVGGGRAGLVAADGVGLVDGAVLSFFNADAAFGGRPGPRFCPVTTSAVCAMPGCFFQYCADVTDTMRV